jgi:hypothetical protein
LDALSGRRHVVNGAQTQHSVAREEEIVERGVAWRRTQLVCGRERARDEISRALDTERKTGMTCVRHDPAAGVNINSKMS